MGDLGYNMGYLLHTTNPRDGINIRGRGQHKGGAIVSDHTTDEPQPTTATKRCPTCGAVKTASAFSKDARSKDKLQSKCKACDAAYCAEHREEIAAKKAQYRQDRREELAAKKAQYYQEHREERIAYNAQWRQDHPQHAAQYRQDHREEIAVTTAAWRKANPDRIRANEHRRRARKAGNGGTHTTADIRRQGDLQGWKCWWRMPGCAIDCRDKYHVDHIVPLVKGGHNNPSNIVISCPHCNDSKGTKLPEEWAGRLL